MKRSPRSTRRWWRTITGPCRKTCGDDLLDLVSRPPGRVLRGRRARAGRTPAARPSARDRPGRPGPAPARAPRGPARAPAAHPAGSRPGDLDPIARAAVERGLPGRSLVEHGPGRAHEPARPRPG